VATVKQIRAGLADALSAIQGVQVSGYMLAAPTPPCVFVSRGPIEYDRAMGRGHDDWTFTVTALVAFSSDRGSQINLDELVAPTGARSVKTALETDKTLGGIVDNVFVSEATEERIYEAAGKPPMLGCEWTARIIG
jgi:hypothetical protein